MLFDQNGNADNEARYDVAVVVEALGRLHGLPAAEVARVVRDNLRVLPG